jgi:ribosome-binding protein aMBF1 (putative translation factor)
MWGFEDCRREYYHCEICGRECEGPPVRSCDWCHREICEECTAWERAPSTKYRDNYRQDFRKFPAVFSLHEFRFCVLCEEERKLGRGKRLLEIFEEGRQRLHGKMSGGD